MFYEINLFITHLDAGYSNHDIVVREKQLTYLEKELNEVNTDQINPLNNISSSKLPLRNDKPNKVNNSDKILSNAPEKIESYFVVPKVVE